MDGTNLDTKETRVMVVEDDFVIRFSIINYLERSGYKVVAEISTGDEAVLAAETCDPDVILMDISLPGLLDGISAAEVIRKRKRIPVVFLTAMTERSFLDRAKETEAYGYLAKPVEPRELSFAVEMAVFRGQMEQRLRDSEEKFRTLVENMGEGLGILDSEGQFIGANPSFLKMMGVPIDELKGKKFLECVAGDSSFYSHGFFKQSAILRQQLEVTCVTGEGNEVHLLLYPFEGPRISGGPDSIAFTAVNLTESKQAKEHIARSDRMIALLYYIDKAILAGKPSREIIRMVMDKAKREVMGCNGAAFMLIDESQKSISLFEGSFPEGQEAIDVFSSTYQDFYPYIQKLNAGKSLEFPLVDNLFSLGEGIKINFSRPSSVLLVPVFSTNKLVGTFLLTASKPNYFNLYNQEKAKLIASEIGVLVAHSILNQAFNNSKQLNNRILDLIPDTIIIVDKSGKLLNYKSGADPIFEDPITGIDFVQFIRNEINPPQEILNQLIELGETVIQNGNNAAMEISFTKQENKKKITVEVRFVPLFNQQLLAIIRDITTEIEAKIRISHAILDTQQKERKRFASDLHDGLGQMLAALSLNLQVLQNSRFGADLVDNKAFQNCLYLTQDAMTDARRVAHNLSPVALEKTGLSPAIGAMIQRLNVGSDSDFSCDLDDDIQRFHSTIETCLYSIAQEMISNVIRHSKSTSATISLKQTIDFLELIAEDNGQGFLIEPGGTGMGLQNLEVRAGLLNGKVTIDSFPGKGTKVSAKFPMEALLTSQAAMAETLHNR